MSGTNQFLPFGIAGAAPVLSNQAYAALPPDNAFPAGILLKEHLNKALRQACVMAAALGGYIATTGQNALDDGNVPALIIALQNALNSQYGVTTNAPQTIAAYHDFTVPLDSLTANLALTPGTWLIDATAASFNSAYYSQTLSVDGTVVQTLPNGGDPTGVDMLPMAGFYTVVITVARNVPIAWAQEVGGNSVPSFVRAIAFKVG